MHKKSQLKIELYIFVLKTKIFLFFKQSFHFIKSFLLMTLYFLFVLVNFFIRMYEMFT